MLEFWYIERWLLSGYSIVLALSFQDNSVERFEGSSCKLVLKPLLMSFLPCEYFPVKGVKSVTEFAQLDFKPKFKHFKYF